MLHSVITYDNSTDNPFNPHHPPKRVTWGVASTAEMGTIALGAVPVNNEDVGAFYKHFQGFNYLMGVTGGPLELFGQLKKLDNDGDGVWQKGELPGRFINQLDKNGDDALTLDELASAASRGIQGGGFLGIQGSGKPGQDETKAPHPGSDDVSSISFQDVDQRIEALMASADVKASVLFFVTTDCPVANSHICRSSGSNEPPDSLGQELLFCCAQSLEPQCCRRRFQIKIVKDRTVATNFVTIHPDSLPS